MNIALLIEFFRRATLCGFTSHNPASLALVGIWRIVLVLCLFAVVGKVVSPVFMYLDAIPRSPLISSSVILYPILGMAAVAHILITATIIFMMAEMIMAVGRLGKSNS